MRIAIFDLTQHPLPLLAGIQRAGERIKDWISPGFFDTKLEIFDIAAGIDQVPSMRNFDALIVSGSERSVYDDISWRDGVSCALHESREMGKPIFGICFGHQIMASTFGGEVRRSSGDAIIGIKKFVQTDGQTFNRFVWHHDQVTCPPSCASIVASSDYCPFASLEYNFPAFSVQYHPEFEKNYFEKLLLAGDGIFLSSGQTQQALKEISRDNVPQEADVKKVRRLLSKNFLACVGM